MPKQKPLTVKELKRKVYALFVLIFAVIGLITVIRSFATPKTTLHISPTTMSTGQQFKITWDRLVNKKGTYSKAKSQEWHIICTGGSSGTFMAQAFEPASMWSDVSGVYYGKLEKKPEAIVGTTVNCRILIQAYSNTNATGPIGDSEWLWFTATIAP